MNDNSLMPFGAKKGKKLGEISDGYLLRLYDTNKLSGKLKEYIEQRIPVLRTKKEREGKEQTAGAAKRINKAD